MDCISINIGYFFHAGALSPPDDLLSSFINSSTVNISWSPPFTLPGTDITGYNISATSNGNSVNCNNSSTTTNYFTSESQFVLTLADVTDLAYARSIVSVSGFNGLTGESSSVEGQ